MVNQDKVCYVYLFIWYQDQDPGLGSALEYEFDQSPVRNSSSFFALFSSFLTARTLQREGKENFIYVYFKIPHGNLKKLSST